MRFVLALTVATALVACSKNKTEVNTPPETGRVATDTVKTTGAKGDSAHTVVTEKAANPTTDTTASAAAAAEVKADSMPHAPTVTPDSAKAPVAPHDSM